MHNSITILLKSLSSKRHFEVPQVKIVSSTR